MKKITSSILAILVILTFAFFALASGSDNATVSDDSVDISNNEQQTQNLKIKVGETFDNENMKISFVSAEPYVESNQYLQPKSGNQFYRLEFNVENLADSDLIISAYSFECYADGVACSIAYASSEDILSATLSKGRKATGAVYFEIPKDAESIEVEYEYDLLSNGKAIFVVK